MRRLYRTNGLWILMVVIVLILQGCSAPKATAAALLPDKSNTLTFVMPGDVTSYDPNKSLETYSAVVLDHCFERLVGIDKRGEVVPAAASSWIISPDGKTYTFTLREDAKWSDGKAVTAQDFKNAWLRLLDPTSEFESSAVFAPYIANGQAFLNGEVSADAVGVEVIDPLTFEVQLSAPTSFFLSMVSLTNFAPVRLDIIQQGGVNWDQNPDTFVTNGPYIMKAYHKEVYVLLAKNPHYWNADALKIPFIKTIMETDAGKAIQKFKSGEVDGVYQILASDLRTIPDIEANIYLDPALGTSYMVLNHQNKLIQDPDFRKALASSIDRQKIVDEVLFGAGTASRYLVPASMMMAGEAFNDFTALSTSPDPEQSKALLEKLRSKGLDLTQELRVLHMSNDQYKMSTAIIVDLWEKELGLRLKVEEMTWAEVYERCLKGDYDIAMMGYSADYAHPMTFLSLFLKNTAVTNILKWSDEGLHNRLLDAMSIQDEQESLKVLRGLEKEIIEGNHLLPLYSRKVISLMSDRVVGWSRDQLSHFNFMEAELK